MGLFDDIFAGNNGVAKTLIVALSGVTATLTIENAGTYDAATDKHLAGTETAITVNTSPPLKYKKLEIDGTVIQVGDSYVIVPAADVTSEIKNNSSRFTVNGETFRIVNHEKIVSGTETSAYKLQLRK